MIDPCPTCGTRSLPLAQRTEAVVATMPHAAGAMVVEWLLHRARAEGITPNEIAGAVLIDAARARSTTKDEK